MILCHDVKDNILFYLPDGMGKKIITRRPLALAFVLLLLLELLCLVVLGNDMLPRLCGSCKQSEKYVSIMLQKDVFPFKHIGSKKNFPQCFTSW